MENTDHHTIKSLSSDEINKIEEFRKSKHTAVLAILFSDIVNSSYATEKLGEQTYSKLRHIHDELFIQIMCRDNAGVIIKQIGDSFLCVFAEPSTSVSRAIEFQRAILKNKENLTVEGYTLTVRIGIHIGQVIVENKLSTDIFGTHVNRAARIESIAKGGQILTSQSIWENAAGFLKENKNEEGIGWVSYGKTNLKGIEGKMDIFEFYPKETGPSSAPAIFRKQRQTRVMFALAGLLPLAVLVFFLVKTIDQKNITKQIATSNPKTKIFYIQFDFFDIQGLDTSAIKDDIISQVITALYPDSVVTEYDLINSYSKQGELYKKHYKEDQKYFEDTLQFSSTLFIKGLKESNKKHDSIMFKVNFSSRSGTSRSSSDDILLSSIKDLKTYFRSWMQNKLNELRLKDILGFILESNDSIMLFQINETVSLTKGAFIKLQRNYSKKEGLNLWMADHEKKIEFFKNNPQYIKELKKEISDFERDKMSITYDLENDNCTWNFDLNIIGKVIEIYDSVGKASWSNKSIFPFIKPKKGDWIFLDY